MPFCLRLSCRPKGHRATGASSLKTHVTIVRLSLGAVKRGVDCHALGSPSQLSVAMPDVGLAKGLEAG